MKLNDYLSVHQTSTTFQSERISQTFYFIVAIFGFLSITNITESARLEFCFTWYIYFEFEYLSFAISNCGHSTQRNHLSVHQTSTTFQSEGISQTFYFIVAIFGFLSITNITESARLEFCFTWYIYFEFEYLSFAISNCGHSTQRNHALKV